MSPRLPSANLSLSPPKASEYAAYQPPLGIERTLLQSITQEAFTSRRGCECFFLARRRQLHKGNQDKHILHLIWSSLLRKLHKARALGAEGRPPTIRNSPKAWTDSTPSTSISSDDSACQIKECQEHSNPTHAKAHIIPYNGMRQLAYERSSP